MTNRSTSGKDRTHARCRRTLDDLKRYYAAKPVTVDVPALLIRINRLYRHNMPAVELYEATRGVWKLGRRRERAKYAFAVFDGIVREVYEIESWHRAATTPYATRDAAQLTTDGRVEFVGRIADSLVRDRFIDGSVTTQFRQGLQSPVLYVNC